MTQRSKRKRWKYPWGQGRVRPETGHPGNRKDKGSRDSSKEKGPPASRKDKGQPGSRKENPHPGNPKRKQHPRSPRKRNCRPDSRRRVRLKWMSGAGPAKFFLLVFPSLDCTQPCDVNQ